MYTLTSIHTSDVAQKAATFKDPTFNFVFSTEMSILSHPDISALANFRTDSCIVFVYFYFMGHGRLFLPSRDHRDANHHTLYFLYHVKYKIRDEFERVTDFVISGRNRYVKLYVSKKSNDPLRSNTSTSLVFPPHAITLSVLK